MWYVISYEAYSYVAFLVGTVSVKHKHRKHPEKILSQTSQRYLRISKHFKGLMESIDEIINCIIHP